MTEAIVIVFFGGLFLVICCCLVAVGLSENREHKKVLLSKQPPLPTSPDTAYYHGVIAALVTERLEAQRALKEAQIGDTEREEAHEQEIQRWKNALERLRQAQDAPRVVALRVVREKICMLTFGEFACDPVTYVDRGEVLAILDAEIGTATAALPDVGAMGIGHD